MLRTLILLAALVPLLAGGAGVLLGVGFLGTDMGADSHLRYLSGLLLAIGAALAWAGLDLPRRGFVWDVLAPVVIAGGLARLGGLALAGAPPWPHALALGMELGVVPLLWWRVRRVKPGSHE